MVVKEISANDYEALPRKVKRDLKRSLEKQGLETPEIIPRLIINESVDKEIFLAAVQVLRANQMSVPDFLDKAFTQLLIASKK